MRISNIHISHHRIPLDPVFHPAWDGQPRPDFTATLVQVVSEDGLIGYGSGDEMIGFERYFHLFLDQDPLELERHYRVLDNLQFHAARYWPMDIALWDLYGKSLGLPIYQLLGGQQNRLRVYASLASLRSKEAMADAALQAREIGFRAVKIRFHNPDWRDDITVIEHVRATVGDKLALMVDCNQGWRMPWDTEAPWALDTAMEVANALAGLNITWLEEPLHRGDYEGMARLRAEQPIAIAGGEMTRELHELHTLVDQNCLDYLQADAVVTGGLSGLSNLRPKLKRAGVILTPHTWGNGVGLLANAHLAAAAGPPPYLEFPYDPPAWPIEARDFLLQTPIMVESDGCLTLASHPGLGIQLDHERLAATQIGETISAL